MSGKRRRNGFMGLLAEVVSDQQGKKVYSHGIKQINKEIVS
jgi:hypothetical protein